MARRLVAVSAVWWYAGQSTYTWSSSDSATDLAWYGSSDNCVSSTGAQGGWRFQSASGGANFGTCTCHSGTQLSDGAFRAVSMCKETDGSVGVSVYNSAKCTGSTAVQGKVQAANVGVFSGGSCATFDIPYNPLDKTVKLENGVSVGCQCGQALAAEVRDGTGLSASPLFTAADGHFDLAWYTSAESCGTGTSITGSWRHKMPLKGAADAADFTGCACHTGRQLSDGIYRAVSVCQQADSSLKVSIFKGEACTGSAEVEGTVDAAFVGMLGRGECVLLKRDNWFDRYLKFEAGIKGVAAVAGAGGKYTFAGGDGSTDFAWYGSSPECAAGEAEESGWRFKSSSQADFSACTCHGAMQLSDGAYRAVSACKNTDGSVEITVNEGLNCSAGSLAMKGTVKAAFVESLKNGECVEFDVASSLFDRTVRLEKGVKIECPCARPIVGDLRDGSTRDPSLMMAAKDGNIDLAWYSSLETCGLGELIQGSWRHDIASPGTADALDFSVCACLGGRQLSDGVIHAVSACPNENGDLALSIFKGMACEGSPAVSGTVPAAFAPVLERGECVALNRFGPDLAVRVEVGATFGISADQAAASSYAFDPEDEAADLTWYGKSTECASGSAAEGGWSFTSPMAKADFNTCKCHVGKQLRDGVYRSAHLCKTAGGEVKVTVYKGRACGPEASVAVQGTVAAGSAAAMSRGECAPLDVSLGFDKTVRVEAGLEVGCKCSDNLEAEPVDGSGYISKPMLGWKDGIFDFAWFSDTETCEETKSASGSLRYPLPNDTKKLAITKCGVPIAGRDVETGAYRAMTICSWTDGALGIEVYEGRSASGSETLSGFVPADKAAFLQAGRCVLLNREGLGFSKYIRLDEGVEIGCRCSGASPVPSVASPDDSAGSSGGSSGTPDKKEEPKPEDSADLADAATGMAPSVLSALAAAVAPAVLRLA